jgi:MFS family permease
MADMTVSAPPPDDQLAKRNVAVLVIAHAILGAQMPLTFIIGGLSGQVLAENKALATLPISIIVICSMLSAPILSAFMGRHGRKAGFFLAAGAGALGACVSAVALIVGSFHLLLLGAAGTGVYMSGQAFFRFAAADRASPEFKPKAISWTLAGGLAAALIGSELVIQTRDLLAPIPFAGAYLAVLVLTLLGAPALFLLDTPLPPRRPKGQRAGRPLKEIMLQPRALVAVICAMVSYALMNLVMTSTPLAVVFCGFSPDDASHVVRWHVIAMFAPSFFTGNLIARFGHLPIIWTGLAMLAGCGVVALMGIELGHFYVALILLGFGWNFSFIGATALLTTTHTPEEQSKVQGANDFLVFGLMSIASLSSGGLMHWLGWEAVNLAMTPFLVLAAGALIWLSIRQRAQIADG